MEEDWSLGYSGYSFDSPLFASTLAEEAANDWKMVGSKKTNKPSRPPTGKCDCIICPGPRGRGVSFTDTPCPGPTYLGRYGALADTGYDPTFSDYNPSDLDYDLPMLMVSPHEGDVPPESGRGNSFTALPPRSDQAKDIAAGSSPKAKTPKPSPSKKELEEGKNVVEAYRLKHKAAIGKMPPSTFVHAFPLNPKPDSKKVSAPQKPLFAENFQMATPPAPAPGVERLFEYPLPDFRPPTRKEERAITQKNQSDIAIAQRNFKFFGLHLLGLQARPEVSSTTNNDNVSSSTHLGSVTEHMMGENGAG